MVAALMAAGPWAAFLLACGFIAWAYHSGRVLSLAEHKRIMAVQEAMTSLHERRADIQERRADTEAQRADVAHAALQKLTAELPEALRQLRAPAQ